MQSEHLEGEGLGVRVPVRVCVQWKKKNSSKEFRHLYKDVDSCRAIPRKEDFYPADMF